MDTRTGNGKPAAHESEPDRPAGGALSADALLIAGAVRDGAKVVAAAVAPPMPLDRDDPEYIRRRQHAWAYADGATDLLKELQGLLYCAVGANKRTMAALRKLHQRARRLADEALPPERFLDKLFDGDW